MKKEEVWPCYECGEDVNTSPDAMLGIDFSFCSQKCFDRWIAKQVRICQACGKEVQTPVFEENMWPGCIFCSWDCIKEYADRGRCHLCKNREESDKFTIKFCSQKCLDRAKKLIEWAEIATGLWESE